MTLTPVTRTGQAAQKPPVDPLLLETDAGTMIEGQYEWREYCNPCALPALAHTPRQHRTISLYEILSSYRQYICYNCRRPLWAPENQATP